MAQFELVYLVKEDCLSPGEEEIARVGSLQECLREEIWSSSI